MDLSKLGITPGPWQVDNSIIMNNGGFKRKTPDGLNEVCVPHSTAWQENAFSGKNATEESKANDKVIAAAPEMLEALVIMGMENTNYTERHDRCRKVVEKATGLSWEEVKRLLEVDNTGDMR